jgi:CheY-like chemotaxis protein/anti-sigma regulatory factor (Ser/Thr protein kinase)
VPVSAADRGKLTQVLVNLLLNAAQAIQSGKVDENEVRVATRRRGDRVIVSVEDTGHGIPDDLRDRIFEPFFSTKPRGVGTGLGLSLAAELVRKHGGEIRTEDTAGRGTRFDIVLPVNTGLTAAETPEAAEVKKATPTVRGRVLVVDDEPVVLKVVHRMLEKNYDVVTAGGGRAALDIIAGDGAFDVVLCDLLMPSVDGQALFEALRESAPQLCDRFVFFTGGVFTPRMRDFVSQVKRPVVEKPVDRARLIEVLDQIAHKTPTASS